MEVSFSRGETLKGGVMSRMKEVDLNFSYFFYYFYFLFDLFSFILFLELGLGLEKHNRSHQMTQSQVT